MLRRLTLTASILLIVAAGAQGVIWPEEFFGFRRTAVEPAPPGEGPIWEELGFEEGERASYELEGKRFSAAAYRFADATGAMAAYQWKRPPAGAPSDLSELAVEFPGGVYLAFGNYILQFDGYRPTGEQLIGMYLVVPRLERDPLPEFPGFIPLEGRVAGSERFVLGPETLAEFAPRIPPSVAGFHFGVEAQWVQFESPKGNLNCGVFSYPTPHIARERVLEFRMLPGIVVKRTGPLIAVVLDPPDADEAQKLLSRINYRASISWDEYSGAPGPTIVEVLLTGFAFVGALIVMAVILGAVFGGLTFLRFWRREVPEDPMILLHLDDK